MIKILTCLLHVSEGTVGVQKYILRKERKNLSNELYVQVDLIKIKERRVRE